MFRVLSQSPKKLDDLRIRYKESMDIFVHAGYETVDFVYESLL